jgi:thioredoxin-like negative regulator of GroEL
LGLTSQYLFLVRLDALAGLGRWQELSDILANPKAPLPDSFRELYRARCARELNQPSQAEALWAKAIAQASHDSNPDATWYLADYALRTNDRAEAWKVFQELSQNPVTARRAYENMVRMAEQEKDTPHLLEILQRMSKDFPEDPSPRNDILYLQLLLNRNIETSRTEAEKFLQSHPDVSAAKVTLALAQLRANQPAPALALLQSIPAPSQQWLPGWQAIYAYCLSRNGKAAEAKSISLQIPLDRLKPEERELLRAAQ